MIIKAQLNHLHIAPRKVRKATCLIKGLETTKAQNQLKNLDKRVSLPILKLLKSALANAHHNFNITKEDKLYIANIIVNQGPSLKRWRPRAFGRAYPVMKRTSHVIMELEAKEGIITKKKSKPTKEKINIDTDASKITHNEPMPAKETNPTKKSSFFDSAPIQKHEPQNTKRRFFQRKAF